MQLRLDLDCLEALQLQAAQARAALLEVFHTMPEAPYLASIPGLGGISAATLLAEIGDPKNFTNASQLIKLAGTQPTPNRSGHKSRSLTPMSHKGRPNLRTALFFASMRAIQSDDVLARRYTQVQERKQNPLCKMQALGVIMNRLLRIAWAVMRDHTMYNPAYLAA